MLEEIVKERLVVLDGAMGTMIVQMKGNNDMLNITKPEVIMDIHRKYLAAGADIITTNTFSSQRISQADYHLEADCAEMAYEGARIAKECAEEYSTPEQPRFVCGSIGPTNKTCSMSPDVSDPSARDLSYDELFNAYCEEVEALIRGGVDAIIIETVFDTLNCKAAIDASVQTMEKAGRKLPIMVSVTISDLAGRTLSGQTLEAFLASIADYPIFSVGLNCSFGAPQMLPYLRTLAARTPFYISVYPNAGLPNAMGQYDETAEQMSGEMEVFMKEGLVNIVGGCCGTTRLSLSRPLQRKPKTISPIVSCPAQKLFGCRDWNCSTSHQKCASSTLASAAMWRVAANF